MVPPRPCERARTCWPALPAIAQDIERSKARLAEIEKPSFPTSYTKPKACEHIERLASAGAPDVMGLVGGYADEIQFPDETRRVEVHYVQGQGRQSGLSS